MALIRCPYCGQSVSDSASRCPHCGNQLVSATVPTTKNNLPIIAMWLCIGSIVLFIINTIYLELYYIPHLSSLSGEELGIWVLDNLRKTTIFDFIGTMSPLLLFTAWLLWFTHKKDSQSKVIKVGIVLCIIRLCITLLRIIPNHTWSFIFDYNITSTVLFFAITSIIGGLIAIIIGISLFFIGNTGKVGNLTKVAGVLFICSYLYDILVVCLFDITHIITYSLALRMPTHFLYAGVLVISTILFYNTYKSSKVINSISESDGLSPSSINATHSTETSFIPPTKKKNHIQKWLIALIIGLVLLLGGAIVWVCIVSKKLQEKELTQETAIEEAYEAYDPDAAIAVEAVCEEAATDYGFVTEEEIIAAEEGYIYEINDEPYYEEEAVAE